MQKKTTKEKLIIIMLTQFCIKQTFLHFSLYVDDDVCKYRPLLLFFSVLNAL